MAQANEVQKGPLVVTLTTDQLEELLNRAVTRATADLLVQKEIMNTKEVAEFIGRSTRTIPALIEDDGLPVHYITPREPRFWRSEVLKWLLDLPSEKPEKEKITNG